MSGIQSVRRSLVIAASIIVLWGCGGGGGGGDSVGGRDSASGDGSSADTTAPVIGSSSVANGATEVSVTPAITLTFSETLDPASVTDATVWLQPAAAGVTPQSVADMVPATVSASGATVTVTPQNRLGLRKNYTLTVGDGVTDVAGNAIAPSTIEFTTRDGVWNNGTTLDASSAGVNSDPQVAAGANGEVLAVWINTNAAQKTVWSARLSAGVWSAPEAVQPTPKGQLGSLSVVANGAGRYLIVWMELDGANQGIRARTWTTSGGWDAIQTVQSNANVDGDEPSAAINVNGQAAVAWRENHAGVWTVWARRYAPGAAWDTATRLDALSSDVNASGPTITMDDSGHSKVVWVQGGGNNDRAYTTSANFGAAWGAAQRLDPDENGPQREAGVRIDGFGNAHAIWMRTDNGVAQPWASRHDVATGIWSTPAMLPVPGNTSDPITAAAISVSRGGTAILVVTRSTELGNVTMRGDTYYLRYVPGEGWLAAQPLELDDSHWWYVVALQMDADGNAIAVLIRTDNDPGNATYSRPAAHRYVAGQGWISVRELVTTGFVQDALLATGADGTTTAIMLHGETFPPNVMRAFRFE